MTLTLLIDLDDTLLSNSMETFVPAYLHGLGEQLAAYAEPKAMAKELMAATQSMIQNDSPASSLKETFDRQFYPALHLAYDDVQPSIDDFYLNKFPALKQLTGFRQDAVDMVAEAQGRGYDIAIATNPLFPLTAIEQRLEWAGFPRDEHKFRLVPSYSTSHFAKPNPAFFAEILGQIGWPEGPVVMVGNDKEADILPARKFGLATFWVTGDEEAVHRCSMDGEPPWASGRLDKLLPWIETIAEDQLQPRLNTPTAILATLKSTPAVIRTMIAGLTPDQMCLQPAPGEWSILETLCHLRDVDREVFIPRVQSVLKDPNTVIASVNADQWADERNYRQQEPIPVMKEYLQSRLQLLSMIEGFKADDWQRGARHIDLGPTSMKELLKISARHDRLHIQIIHSLKRSSQHTRL